MVQQKKFGWLACFFISLSLAFLGQNQVALAKTQTMIPTLFIHGWGSSYHAEEKMAQAAKKAGVTKTIILADVDLNGNVTLKGKIPAQAKAPLVLVNFENNKNVNAKMEAGYLKSVLETLQQKYHFQKMNLVGHSMGNMAILDYLLENAQNKELPQLNKQVALAAFPNGLVGEMPTDVTVAKDGRPDQETSTFTELLALRELYPKGASVLNIYGNLEDGSDSDGPVPVRSAQTLRYLVTPNAKSYEEHQITGKLGQHSKLHNNREVDRLLIKFLWGK